MQCEIQKSNNNLDLVKFHDKFYLAFRTAPNHFPSGKAVMYIVSSTDLEKWNYEIEHGHSKSHNSPFKNRPLKSKVVLTLFNGKIVFEDISNFAATKK